VRGEGSGVSCFWCVYVRERERERETRLFLDEGASSGGRKGGVAGVEECRSVVLLAWRARPQCLRGGCLSF
jgi:hypothetical protein